RGKDILIKYILTADIGTTALKDLAEAEAHVHFGGRLGHYRYYDMDKVIRAALDDLKQLKA
ncbi:MAG: hypothetical protein IJ947_04780, partial [Phascolarctobacterium sp.]|nr:hypothetical protein [Phascolarctobacterium sp.]